MKAIKVLLAEDHSVVREGIRILLSLESDLEVVGEARDGRRAVLLSRQLRPDVVLMDIAMPLLNGLEATRQIVATLPETKVVVLSAHPDDAYVRDSIDAGAMGYLLKQSTTQDVCQGIRVVHRGGRCFSQEIAQRLDRIHPSRARERSMPGDQKRSLTSREFEVLQLVAEGKANKETADELGISIKTVEKHRTHLMQKLDIHHTAGLTRFAMEEGIVESRIHPEPT